MIYWRTWPNLGYAVLYYGEATIARVQYERALVFHIEVMGVYQGFENHMRKAQDVALRIATRLRYIPRIPVKISPADDGNVIHLA